MKRREFITLLGGARRRGRSRRARSSAAGCRPSGSSAQARLNAEPMAWLPLSCSGCARRGWIEGRNLAIEYRWGEGRNARFAEIAAEFVRLKVDVIFTFATPRCWRPSRRPRSSPSSSPCRTIRSQRLGRKPRATGRQCHRCVESIDRTRREAGGAFREVLPGLPGWQS